MGRNWAGGESVLLCWNSLTSASVTPRTLKSSPHQLVAQIVKVTNSKVSATECREKRSNGVAKRKEPKKNDEEMIQSLKWKQNTPQQLSWAQSKPVGWPFSAITTVQTVLALLISCWPPLRVCTVHTTWEFLRHHWECFVCTALYFYTVWLGCMILFDKSACTFF